MSSLLILDISFLLITSTLCQYIIRGERTRFVITCPISNGLWLGPRNQTIDSHSKNYEIKYSSDQTQLIIDHFTGIDEGEYLCLNNETNDLIERYEYRVGTIKNVLIHFSIVTSFILLLIPIFWYLGEKHSGLHQ